MPPPPGIPLGTNETLARAMSFSNETELTFDVHRAHVESHGGRALLRGNRPLPPSPLRDSGYSWSRPPGTTAANRQRALFHKSDYTEPYCNSAAIRSAIVRDDDWIDCRKSSGSSPRWEPPIFRCGTCKCNPDPSERCRSAPRPHRRPASITPAAVSFRIPASVAAEAGSQPIPRARSWLWRRRSPARVTFSTMPRDARTSCNALGQDTGSPMRIAVASVSGLVHRVQLAALHGTARRTARRLRPGSPPAAASCRSIPARAASRRALPNADVLPRLPPGSTIQSGGFQSR